MQCKVQVPNRLFVAECLAAQRALIEPVKGEEGSGDYYRWTDINASMYVSHMVQRLMEAHPEQRPIILQIEREMQDIVGYVAPEIATRKMVACFAALSPYVEADAEEKDRLLDLADEAVRDKTFL